MAVNNFHKKGSIADVGLGFNYASELWIWSSDSQSCMQFFTFGDIFTLHKKWSFPLRISSERGSFNNYVTLKLPLTNPPLPSPHHYASSRMITKPPLRYVMPDTNTLFIIYFSFLKLKKNPKDTHPPMTHPLMFLNN